MVEDGLKSSLEKAIEELRDSGPVTGPEEAPVPASMEEALAAAPAVSPHYTPPKPAPVEPPVPSSTGVLSNEADAYVPSPDEKLQRFSEEATKMLEQPGSGLASAPPAISERGNDGLSPLGQGLHQALGDGGAGAAQPPVSSPPSVKELPALGAAINSVQNLASDVAAQTEEAVEKTKEMSSSVWRWATIGISCAGGLASGWVGSNIAGQYSTASHQDKLALVGAPEAGAGSGKTDRAKPLDETRCTVLELDRGTGLVFAKPCRPVATADISSTLNKSDLLVKQK
jgi:hypothetical protein